MNQYYDVYKKGDEEYLISTCDCCGRREKTMCRVVRLTGEQMKSWFAFERLERLICLAPLLTLFLIAVVVALVHYVIPGDRVVLRIICYYFLLPSILIYLGTDIVFSWMPERFGFVRRMKETEKQQRKQVFAELGLESVDFKRIRFHGALRINEAAEESYLFVEQDVVLKYHD